MKRDGYWRNPKQARDGWWYANKGTIDVVSAKGGIVVIRRQDLLEYIRRTGGMRRPPSTRVSGK